MEAAFLCESGYEGLKGVQILSESRRMSPPIYPPIFLLNLTFSAPFLFLASGWPVALWDLPSLLRTIRLLWHQLPKVSPLLECSRHPGEPGV